MKEKSFSSVPIPNDSNVDPRKRHMSFDNLMKVQKMGVPGGDKRNGAEEKENRILDDFYKNITKLRRPDKGKKTGNSRYIP